jgi:hypothetical protein
MLSLRRVGTHITVAACAEALLRFRSQEAFMAGMPDLQKFRTISPDPQARASEKEFDRPEAVVAAMYDLLSGPAEAEKKRDWERFRALALPNARFLICHGWDEAGHRTAGLREWDMDGFVDDAKRAYQSEGFWEREIWGRTERFGGIAHRFSTYESRLNSADSEPVAFGINSIQLAQFEGRWWIVSVIWDHQRPEQPIPSRYLRSEPV